MSKRHILAAGLAGTVFVWGLFFILVGAQPSSGMGQLPTLASLPTFTSTSPALEATVPPQTEPTIVDIPDEPVPGQLILNLASDAPQEAVQAYIDSFGGEIIQSNDALNTVTVRVPDTVTVQSLPPSPLVASSEPDYYVSALVSAPSSDTYYADQWALPVIGAPDAWAALPADAPTVTVAVIDSGSCANHPDLSGRISSGWDFVDNDDDPDDTFGHGCQVSGIIAANADNGIGIAGVAPNAMIMPVRVLDVNGVGTYSNVAAGIVWAVDHGAPIINLSLGGANPSNVLEAAVNYAVSRNVTLVAAAGNTGGNILYPAAYNPVIAVGSVDQNLQRSSFSSYLPQLDLLAPGRHILTTSNDGDYTMVSGTSFVAPQVVGIAALNKVLGLALNLDGNIVRFGSVDSVIASTLIPTPVLSTSTGPDSSLETLGSPITQLFEGDYRFLKIDLSDPRVSFQVELANNNIGGYQSLNNMKRRYEEKGYIDWAIINGDYFDDTYNCPSDTNCAQGPTYINGSVVPNWSGYAHNTQRANISFSRSNDVHLAIGASANFMTISGGPWIYKNGVYQCDPHPNGTTTTFKHYDGAEEIFGGNVGSYCDRPNKFTLIGYSADYVYMGVSTGDKTISEVAHWLRSKGAYNILKLDSGTSSGMYYNGQPYGNTGRQIANHLAVIVKDTPTEVGGLVVDASGRPILGATVSTSTGGNSATTDANGIYILNNVPPGNTTITAYHSNFGSKSVTFNVISNSSQQAPNIILTGNFCAASLGEAEIEACPTQPPEATLPPTTPTTRNAEYQIKNITYPATVNPGERFLPEVNVCLFNGATLMQSRGDMLRNFDGNLFGAFPHVAVEGTRNSGQCYVFRFYDGNPITAPTSDGTYHSQWKLWVNGQWVKGTEVNIEFRVGSGGSDNPTGPAAILFDNQNYGGEQRGYGKGRHDIGDTNFNDRAHSMTVPDGWSVMLYEHGGFNRGGAFQCFNERREDLPVPYANGVSSLEVFDQPNCVDPSIPPVLGACGGVILHDGGGNWLTLSESDPKLFDNVTGGEDWDDRARWIEAIGPWRATAYDGENFEGVSFGPVQNSIIPIGTNVSSVRVEQTRPCDTPIPSYAPDYCKVPSDQWGVYLVKDSGETLRLTFSSSNLSPISGGWNDHVSKMYVKGPYRAWAYDGEAWQGWGHGQVEEGSIRENLGTNVSSIRAEWRLDCSNPPRPPAAPVNFTITNTLDSITLNWNNVDNEQGYKVYKWDGANFTLQAQLAADVTTYTDIGLSCANVYYYQVRSYNDIGESDPSWVQADCVPNDSPQSAVALNVLPSLSTQPTGGAQPSDGAPVPTCSFNVGKAVWYKYTSTNGSIIQISTSGTDYDTVLALFTGTPANLTEVSCNDDESVSNSALERGDVRARGVSDFVGLTSAISWHTTPGTTYYIMVGGYNGTSGNLVLQVDDVPNNSPTAEAGIDLVLIDTDGDGNVGVTLDGSGSSDPDAGDTLTYIWYRDGVQIGDGISPNVTLSVGTNYPSVVQLTLIVIDSQGAQGIDTMMVTVNAPPPPEQTITLYVDQSADDVNEDGNNYSTSYSSIWVGTGSKVDHSYTGLRFNAVNIPPGAIVTSARVEFFAPQDSWISVDATIYAEATDHSAPFTNESRPSMRSLTLSSVLHSSNIRWLGAGWYDLGDITPLILETISRPGWQLGNSLSIILRGGGRQWGRKFVTSFDGNPLYAPRLVVTFTSPVANSAPLAQPDQARTWIDRPIAVNVLSNDSDANHDQIRIASIVQPANGTVTNTHATVMYKPNTGFSGTDSFSYQLCDSFGMCSTGAVSILVDPAPIITTQVQVNASSDDVNTVGENLELASGNMWIGTGGSATNSYAGLRFNNVVIPQGAAIISARLEVYNQATNWITINVTIAAEATDNSLTFSTDSLPASRPLTNAFITHSSDTRWEAGNWQSLDDVTSVLQEIVSRPGWQSGNSFSLILKGFGGMWGRKFVTSFDGNPLFAPRLVIEWAVPSDVDPTAYLAMQTFPQQAVPQGNLAGFDASTLRGTAPLDVQFTSQIDGQVLTYAWDFGDSTSNNDANPLHSYLNPGQYIATLTITTAEGMNSAQTVITVDAPIVEQPTVIPPPVAAFTTSVLSGEAPLSVQFANQSSGDIAGYTWNFGDGGISTEINPVYTFATPGQYTIILTATGLGGSSSAEVVIAVNSLATPIPTLTPTPPIAAFTSNVLTGEAPLIVQFTNQSIGEVTNFNWDFGDGTGMSVDANPIHTYSAPGQYIVTLIVNGTGGTSSVQTTIIVNAAPTPIPLPLAPVASFTATTIIGEVPLTVQFTNQSSGDISSYLWDFGDGTTGVEVNPIHVYTNPGVYTVNLTVIGLGGTTTTQMVVSVDASTEATQ